MHSLVKLAVLTSAAGALAGCVETSAPVNDGLSGTNAEFNAMT